MIKKITSALLLGTLLIGSVACSSSDDNTSGSEQQNSSKNTFKINPPSWLHGEWGIGQQYKPEIKFTPNNIIGDNYGAFYFENWREDYDDLNSPYIEKSEPTKYIDIKSTNDYYEAQYTTGLSKKGVIDVNLKVTKIASNQIKVVETYYDVINGNGKYISKEKNLVLLTGENF
ncbi:hypothetical protein [Myroides odoratus]|uniref:hypothetical protein n=1 Tax=Myroides odoratus TaxID=256 RepID=UPI0007659700|nr:hypothetical protein [Myroides odoratus]